MEFPSADGIYSFESEAAAAAEIEHIEWIRPKRLTRTRSSAFDEYVKVDEAKTIPIRRRTSSSAISVQPKRTLPYNEFRGEFESPTKKVKLGVSISPFKTNRDRFVSGSGSPDPKALVQRMICRDGDGDADGSPRTNLEESNLSTYLPSFRTEITPTRLRFGQRKTLLPAPEPISPSSFLVPGGSARSRVGRKLIMDGDPQKAASWKANLCLDWSLKTGLRIESKTPFGWTSAHLKASEESSGTSAYARCIDISTAAIGDGAGGNGCSQLDTSLGAQFHAACLYWQHPHIPSVNLFPRMGEVERGTAQLSSARLDDKVVSGIQAEWAEAFRSSFQLMRSRQCPFFYVCGPQFTALFSAAGTQGDERPQIYVNPSTKGLREALRAEGVNFSMPYWKSSSENDANGHQEGAEYQPNTPTKKSKTGATGGESDDETDKWLDDMGISQDVSLTSSRTNEFNPEASVNANKSLLLVAGGNDSLSFFNFLLNAKQFLITTSGSNGLAGIPPTILSPVAFHGATLRTLKVKQSRSVDLGKHNIELSGPVLPHVIHQLCSLLSSTVENYAIQITTLKHTIPLNLYSNVKVPPERLRPSAFELQNLSDCGLRPSILETFCKCDNCDTMKSRLECKDSLFQWY